jgi:hypothetical protein
VHKLIPESNAICKTKEQEEIERMLYFIKCFSLILSMLNFASYNSNYKLIYMLKVLDK